MTSALNPSSLIRSGSVTSALNPSSWIRSSSVISALNHSTEIRSSSVTSALNPSTGIRSGSVTSALNPSTVLAEVYRIGSLFHSVIVWGKERVFVAVFWCLNVLIVVWNTVSCSTV